MALAAEDHKGVVLSGFLRHLPMHTFLAGITATGKERKSYECLPVLRIA